MKKKMRMFIAVSALFATIVPCVHAAPVSVWLDNGALAPGSSNTETPFTIGGRDSTWDVSATAENGLAEIGAAVMSVRMLTSAWPNGDGSGISRTATGGFGFGLAVTGSSNDKWMDAGEAGIFQLNFYSDVAKTTEITGVDITLNSMFARTANTNLAVDFFVGSGELVLTAESNDGFVTLDGNKLLINSDTANSSASELGLAPVAVPMTDFYTINSGGGITFSETNTFWVRRRALNAASNAAYELANMTFDVSLAAQGYVAWAAGWGVDIGAETNDYDNDGLLNIYEYGLEGDPTNALNQGTAPTFGMVGSEFDYIYPQLSDPDSGLTYLLETCTDLVVGAWTNTGYTVEGTNVTGGTLDFVTNVADTVADQKFIRLIIE